MQLEERIQHNEAREKKPNSTAVSDSQQKIKSEC